MEKFRKTFLKTKKVSIWGIGYLGYTSLLKLQNYGIKASIYDFNEKRLDELTKGNYPSKEQFNSWSKNGSVPLIDLNYITITKDVNKMFDNNIHIISFPNLNDSKYKELAQIFIENNKKLKKSLVIFQSASYPNQLQKDFLDILDKKNIKVDISTVFRSDWAIEDFYKKSNKRTISGNSKLAYKKIKYFLSFLNIKSISLEKIEEAEVYENAKNSLQYTVLAFFNQLSLAYPHININNLAIKLLSEIDFSTFKLGVSNVDYKSEQSINNLIRSSIGSYLTILDEANSTNIAYLFYYVDLLKSKKITSVTIFGLSSYNSLKDIKMSPSVILAEYLHKNNIDVIICDDSFSSKEVKNYLPYCSCINIESERICSDAIIIMNINNQLRFLEQDKIKKTGLYDTKIILDNTGFFKDFIYSKNTVYHQFGDNKLIKVNN